MKVLRWQRGSGCMEGDTEVSLWVNSLIIHGPGHPKNGLGLPEYTKIFKFANAEHIAF
jgi:hypothetical protein